MKKSLKTNILVLLVTLLVFFAAFELAVRAFFPLNPVWNKYHEHFVYTSNHGSTFVRYDHEGNMAEMTINERGYRGPVIPYEKGPGKNRIFVVGDSFVECFWPGLESCFTTHIQEELGGGYEVIAYGTSSWALDNEYKVLELEGMRYDPDVVIVTYYVNDFWDASRDFVFSVEDGKLRDNTPIEWSFNKKFFFHMNQYFHSVRFATKAMSSFVSITDLANVMGASSFPEEGGLEYIAWSTPKEIFIDEEREVIEKTYEKAGLILDKYRELSERKGFRLIFAFVPLKEQVSAGALEEFRVRKGLGEDFDVNLPYDRITGMLGNRSIEFIDPREEMRDIQLEMESEGKSLYYETDIHFNPTGQEVFGNIILDYLAG